MILKELMFVTVTEIFANNIFWTSMNSSCPVSFSESRICMFVCIVQRAQFSH